MRFDDLPISEADLLAWVENELSAERRRDVDRALASDATLRRALEGMSADRVTLRAMSREATPAPAGLVARALEMAEREAVVGLTEPEPVIARVGPMIRARFAVAAAFVAAFAGAYAVREGLFTHNRPLRGAPIPGASDEIAGLTDAHAASALAAAPTPPTPSAPAPSSAPANTPPADAVALAPTRDEIAGMPPLRAVLNAIDAGHADPLSQFVTLESLNGQPRTIAMNHAPRAPRVSPASYSDALVLAGLNRLGVRVQTDDPAKVERVIKSFGERMNRDVKVTSTTSPSGAVHYEIETDRDESELGLLVAAIRNACDECAHRTYFDVPWLPPTCVQCVTPAPEQNLGSATRVCLPVTIERISR